MEGHWLLLNCKHCNQKFQYNYQEDDMTALTASWKTTPLDLSLLSSQPEKDQYYTIVLSAPLQLELDKKFWCTYMSPMAEIDGFENAEDIDSLLFCFVETIELISTEESSATLRVKVIKTHHPLQEYSIAQPDLSIPLQILTQNPGHTLEFEHTAVIDVNIQSDLGVTAIIKKEGQKKYIVALNEWDFHRDIWYSCLIDLDTIILEQRL